MQKFVLGGPYSESTMRASRTPKEPPAAFFDYGCPNSIFVLDPDHFFLSLFYLKESVIVYGSDILLLSEFISIVSILCYNFIEFIILLYTFLIILFA